MNEMADSWDQGDTRGRDVVCEMLLLFWIRVGDHPVESGVNEMLMQFRNNTNMS